MKNLFRIIFLLSNSLLFISNSHAVLSCWPTETCIGNYDANEFPLSLGANDSVEAMFTTEFLEGSASMLDADTVRIILSGSESTSVMVFQRGTANGGEVHNVDSFMQSIQIDLNLDGTVGGETTIDGQVENDFDADAVITPSEIPGTSGTPDGLLSKGIFNGFDENIAAGSHIVAARTTNFSGWASQFFLTADLFLEFFDPQTMAPKDWVGVDFLLNNNVPFDFKARVTQVTGATVGVPEPSVAWLLCSGLIGMIGISRLTKAA